MFRQRSSLLVYANIQENTSGSLHFLLQAREPIRSLAGNPIIIIITVISEWQQREQSILRDNNFIADHRMLEIKLKRLICPHLPISAEYMV